MSRKRSRLGRFEASHGHYVGNVPSLTYRTWYRMINRCTRPSSKSYKRYGGRGITICKRWMRFENFLADMGVRPSLKHTIERKDNEGNYRPGNCCWATYKEQARNRSNNRLLTFKGRTLPVAAWAEEVGLKSGTLWVRLKRGWSVQRALSTGVAG